jgi:hypothetical protein
MGQGGGLDEREATAALRSRSPERLRQGFERLVAAEAAARGWDPRDTMISLAAFVDCARRLGADPVALLGPAAATGPDWFRETFEAFVRRENLVLRDFGWSIRETADGPAYRFAWPPDPPARPPGASALPARAPDPSARDLSAPDPSAPDGG